MLMWQCIQSLSFLGGKMNVIVSDKIAPTPNSPQPIEAPAAVIELGICIANAIGANRLVKADKKRKLLSMNNLYFKTNLTIDQS